MLQEIVRIHGQILICMGRFLEDGNLEFSIISPMYHGVQDWKFAIFFAFHDKLNGGRHVIYVSGERINLFFFDNNICVIYIPGPKRWWVGRYIRHTVQTIPYIGLLLMVRQVIPWLHRFLGERSLLRT